MSGMEPNPYEAPKESDEQSSREPWGRADILVAVLHVMTLVLAVSTIYLMYLNARID